MSVAIAELSGCVNHDPFRSKGDPAQNGLFEEVVREIQFEEVIAFQKGKLITQNCDQVECDSLVDSVIDLVPALLMNEHSKDSKEISFFVIEQEDIKNRHESVKINSNLIEHQLNMETAQESSEIKDSIVKNDSFPMELQQKINDVPQEVDTKISTPYAVANFIFQEENNIFKNVEKTPFQMNEATFLDINNMPVDSKLSLYIENKTQEFLGENSSAETLKLVNQKNINQQLNVGEHKMNELIGEKPQAESAKPVNQLSGYTGQHHELQQNLTLFTGGQESIQIQIDPDDAIVKNASLYIENEMKAFLRENKNVETLKLGDRQSNVVEYKPRELIEENSQADGEKLTHQVSGHHHELQSKIIAQPKIDSQSGFSILTSSNNHSKEFILTNQSNGLNQINDPNKLMIGLKMGNITHQEGVQSLKISILPHELGTIKLDLKTNVETKLTEAHFTFSHQDGFDLFQGNRQDLFALLGKSGLDIQPDKVSFDLLNFSDSSSQFAQEHQKNAHDLNQKTHFLKGVNNESSLGEMNHIQPTNLTETSLLNLMV